jgi:hypothetical protein
MARLLIFCTVLFYCSTAVHAQEGCVSTATGYLYPNLISSYGNVYDRSPVIQNTHTLYCMQSTGSSCFIRSSSACQGCSQLGGYYYQSGNEYSFTYVACPIDNYCWLFLLLIGLFGYFNIRRFKIDKCKAGLIKNLFIFHRLY